VSRWGSIGRRNGSSAPRGINSSRMSSDGTPVRPTDDGQPGEEGGGGTGGAAAGGRACLSVVEMREIREREQPHGATSSAARGASAGSAQGGVIGTPPATDSRGKHGRPGQFGRGNTMNNNAMRSEGEMGYNPRGSAPREGQGVKGAGRPLVFIYKLSVNVHFFSPLVTL